MPSLKEHSDWLRAPVKGQSIGVDREANVIRGYVLAQEGPFKSQGRGEFDLAALKKIHALARKNPMGLKSRFAHPTLSGDGLGKFLGRSKDVFMGNVTVLRDGKPTLLHAVRGDLHFDPTALDEPVGGGKPLGLYIMDLAESDPDALSSSLVLHADEITRLDPKTKRPLMGEDGEPLPPLWVPIALHASDIVDVGDACDGLLQAQLGLGGLPDDLVRQASQVLNQVFPGQPREVVEARCLDWLQAYLSFRFGDEEELTGSAGQFDDPQSEENTRACPTSPNVKLAQEIAAKAPKNLTMTRGVAALQATNARLKAKS